jgi:hypothetical protein
MAIDDEIDQARLQIEFDTPSAAPRVVTTILDVLSSLGAKPLKPVAAIMKLANERRASNVQYLLEATIARLRTVEDELKSLSEEHKRFIEEEFPRLLLEAVDRAQQASSKSKIDRLSMIVVQTTLQGPTASLAEADEALRITVDLNEEDIDVLASINSVQMLELRGSFIPDINIVNQSWKKLQGLAPFNSPKSYSICAKLQSFGLIVQVERIPTMLDLKAIPYSILKKGADYLDTIGKLYSATIVNAGRRKN